MHIVFLQETHVGQTKIDIYERKYARIWGYKTRHEQRALSFWTPSEASSGGVAILINPHSRCRDTTPWHPELWCSNFCAIKATIDNTKVYMMNIYGNRSPEERNKLYSKLAKIKITDVIVNIGGDFNETINEEYDRTNQRSGKRTTAQSLQRLISAWGISDCLNDEIASCDTRMDVHEFHARQHTYRYTLPCGKPASSRIDRWYISTEAINWIRTCTATTAGSDPVNGRNIQSLRSQSARIT